MKNNTCFIAIIHFYTLEYKLVVNDTSHTHILKLEITI